MKTGLLVAMLVSAVTAGCRGDARGKTIGLRQRIHHDDFAYSVQAFEMTDRIGTRRAKGSFLIVTFQVENQAKRVDHEWTNDIAYVVDASGREVGNDAEAERALDAVTPFGRKDRYITAAGRVETTKLVFDVPADLKEPYLRVRGWFLMGDMFDLNQYKRTRVQLF